VAAAKQFLTVHGFDLGLSVGLIGAVVGILLWHTGLLDFF